MRETALFVVFVCSVEVMLGTMVCDPASVTFSETLPSSDVNDNAVFDGVEDETPIVTLDELETSVDILNCSVGEVTGTLMMMMMVVVGDPVCIGELL